MAFNLGLKVVRRLAEDQRAITWYKAKLSAQLFKGEQEKTVFEWVNTHLSKHHALPMIETLEAKFPEFKEFTTPEPASYYIELLENRYAYDMIVAANSASLAMLDTKKNTVDGEQIAAALEHMKLANEKISEQRQRTRILDMAKEAPKLVLQHYHNVNQVEGQIEFGWPYLDEMTGGALPGDVISYVGRPAAGKTFKMLASALHNWLKGQNILFASMEMNHLSIAQRAAAMYAHTNLTQLSLGAYASKTYGVFANKMLEMAQEKSKLYIVDGNLAASVEDIYLLASQLKCTAVYIDGAYLLRHKNPKLDRFTKVAENVENMKRYTTDIEIPTFASWQFNRDASKKMKSATGEKAGLEDIAYSDAIPQTSSVVLAMLQEEGIETMHSRMIDVLKGRGGQVGQFAINWDFINMNFSQVLDSPTESTDKLGYI